MDPNLTELLIEIERLRAALQAIRDTPRKDGILACQRIASAALAGDTARQPLGQSLGDPAYFAEVIQYLHWRFKGKCAYCSADGAEQIDHVQPVSRGGSDAIGNLVLACASCNKSKGARTAEEFGFLELRLLTLGQSLHGWRKSAETQRKSAEAVRRIFGSKDDEEQPF